MLPQPPPSDIPTPQDMPDDGRGNSEKKHSSSSEAKLKDSVEEKSEGLHYVMESSLQAQAPCEDFIYPRHILAANDYSFHIPHPTKPHHHPPLPLYGNPPAASCAPPESMNAYAHYYSHYVLNTPYHNYLYHHAHGGPCTHSASPNNEAFPTGGGLNERNGIPLKLRETKQQKQLDHSMSASLSKSRLTKSVRRRKKMYSDFVGVTYNKTHAKYQACITHYRKQHYLGRYKLAVDAALAYDESARLLKGMSWKVNFATRQVYEESKLLELQRIGKKGDCPVDIAGSLTAVGGTFEVKVPKVVQNLAVQEDVAYPSRTHVARPELRCEGQNLSGTVEDGVAISDQKSCAPAPLPHPPASSNVHVAEVTPSTSNLSGALSDHITSDKASCTFDSPLPLSPNPTRHVMGTTKNSPDSVIRPTVLSYQSLGCARKNLLTHKSTAQHYLVNSCEEIAANSDKKVFTHDSIVPASKMTSCRGNERIHKNVSVIQNGTLAAASALMTLFGNELSP